MDDLVYDALVELTASIDKQNKIAAEQLDATRGLIGVLEEVAQTNADLIERMKVLLPQ